MSHCATGDNFFLTSTTVGDDSSRIYGTSITRDSSFVDVKLSSYGIDKINSLGCAPDAFAYTVIGTNTKSSETMAYVGYGNIINDFNNRAHSIVSLGTSDQLSITTFGSTDMFRSYTGLSVYDAKAKQNTIWVFDMIGPKIHLYFDKDGQKGSDTTRMEIFVESNTITDQNLFHKVINDAKFLSFNYNIALNITSPLATPTNIGKGSYKIGENEINGHYLQAVAESPVSGISLGDRLQDLKSTLPTDKIDEINRVYTELGQYGAPQYITFSYADYQDTVIVYYDETFTKVGATNIKGIKCGNW
jgi:hypothetical protein